MQTTKSAFRLELFAPKRIPKSAAKSTATPAGFTSTIETDNDRTYLDRRALAINTGQDPRISPLPGLVARVVVNQ